MAPRRPHRRQQGRCSDTYLCSSNCRHVLTPRSTRLGLRLLRLATALPRGSNPHPPPLGSSPSGPTLASPRRSEGTPRPARPPSFSASCRFASSSQTRAKHHSSCWTCSPVAARPPTPAPLPPLLPQSSFMPPGGTSRARPLRGPCTVGCATAGTICPTRRWRTARIRRKSLPSRYGSSCPRPYRPAATSCASSLRLVRPLSPPCCCPPA